jgi:hypothetical protein
MMKQWIQRWAVKSLACMLVMTLPAAAADQPVASDSSESRPAPSEIEMLKKMLADQQRQIDELRQALLEKKDAPASIHPSTGQVASTTGILPPGPVPVAAPSFAPTAVAPPQAKPDSDSSPLQLKIGDAYITPVGFMDFTSVTRSTNPGSGIGTNFGSVPYGNTQAGALTEWRLSPQNSRVGFRVDALVKDWKVLGYLETDFLGQINNPPNGGLAVSSNPYPLRMRLYWVDLKKGKSEVLAGQTWSLMTPNRKGLSPLPGDLFYSQDIDVNYQVGLTWGRIPEFRYVYHPNDKVAFGVALSNSEPYVGGANGGSGATLPAWVGAANAVSGAVLGGQINNGSSTISSAALHPDIIAKIAFDPTSRVHFEVAGVEITNKVSDPATTPAFQTFTKVGGGVSANLNVEVFKNFRLLTNNFWSDGGGRYIFGQAPDFILRANGDISLVHSGSTVTGFEATVGKTLFYGYYGGVYIQKNLAIDTNGSKIGYGPIASDGQNRAIQEATFGTNTTLMRDPKWGAVNLMFQYSYLQRNPWLVTGTNPSNAQVHMGFFNLRYTLPGSAPTLGK